MKPICIVLQDTVHLTSVVGLDHPFLNRFHPVRQDRIQQCKISRCNLILPYIPKASKVLAITLECPALIFPSHRMTYQGIRIWEDTKGEVLVLSDIDVLALLTRMFRESLGLNFSFSILFFYITLEQEEERARIFILRSTARTDVKIKGSLTRSAHRTFSVAMCRLIPLLRSGVSRAQRE
jgi:hypothetical protein